MHRHGDLQAMTEVASWRISHPGPFRGSPKSALMPLKYKHLLIV